MRHRTLGLLAALISLPLGSAQLGYLWSPDELRTESDLVVIAAAVATRDTGTRSEISDLRPPFPVVELQTEFTVLSILKGVLSRPTIVLRHYRADSDRLKGGVINGPHPLVLPAGAPGTQYLLYLKRDPDGIFVPTSGQVFPGDSVFTLRKAG